jgi:hypothetical protein
MIKIIFVVGDNTNNGAKEQNTTNNGVKRGLRVLK